MSQQVHRSIATTACVANESDDVYGDAHSGGIVGGRERCECSVILSKCFNVLPFRKDVSKFTLMSLM